MTRPRTQQCPCGEKMVLALCGVKEHLYTKRTKREQMDNCNGRIYIHLSTGGIECPQAQKSGQRGGTP